MSTSLSRRPLSVTLAALGVLTFAAFYLVRGYSALAQWSFLERVLPFSPLYLAATGWVWGLAGLSVTWGVWRGWRKARRMFWAVFVGHGLYFWLDRLLMPGDAERRANDLFWVIVYILTAAISLWALHRRAAGAFFIRNFSGSQPSGAQHE